MDKQNMWFLTLFSLILVLSVYYITMPNELLLTNNSNTLTEEVNSSLDEVNNEKDANEEVSIQIEECESVIAYNETLEDTRNKQINDLEAVMLDTSKTTDEKNEAYEQIKYLNELTGKEEKLEEKIKNTYKIDNFIEIDNSSIKVVAAKKEHDITLANKIMQSIQEEFTNKMYITVKFES